MEHKETFKMTYSAQQQQEVENIRRKYLPSEASKLDQLRALDKAVTRKATARSISLGVAGCLILGAGMSLVMSEFGAWVGAAATPLGIGLGLAGMAMLAAAFPIYHRVLRREREKIAPEILRLSDELRQ